MTAITTTTLYTQSWTTLKDVINLNVTDPATGQVSSSRKWIYTLEPDFKSNSFQGYPIIVIQPGDMQDENYNLGRDFKNNILRFKITLYQKYTDANSVSQLETMANQLVNGIRILASIATFQSSTMHHPKIQSSPMQDEDIHMQRVITRAFLIEFEVPLNMDIVGGGGN